MTGGTRAVLSAEDAVIVAAAVEELRQAMISADRTRLAELADDGLTYGHGNGRLENKAAFIEGVVHAGFAEVVLSDQTIALVGDCALVRHVMMATRPNGPPENIGRKLGVLLVWRRLDGRWRLVARQAVVLPGA